jgi:TrmH family RNA methyltransferase
MMQILKQIRQLQQRKHRRATGLFYVEGIAPVMQAVAAGIPLIGICHCPELLRSPSAQQMLLTQAQRGVPCYPISRADFESVASKENPQGIIAVGQQITPSLSDLAPASHPWLLALQSPQDPGNVGTVLRTIDAVGACGLLLLDGGVDVYHPNALRASLGAAFWLPSVSCSTAEFWNWAGQNRYDVIGTSTQALLHYQEWQPPSQPHVLLLGSEQKGLSEVDLAQCHARIRLPMLGKVSSLNLGVAAGILLYHTLAHRTENSR